MDRKYNGAWMWTRQDASDLGTTTYGLRSQFFRTTYLPAIELGLKWEDFALVLDTKE